MKIVARLHPHRPVTIYGFPVPSSDQP